jgi:hypothetical protein
MGFYIFGRDVFSVLSIAVLILGSFASAASPPVAVKLQASWKSPQLPLEILYSPSASI